MDAIERIIAFEEGSLGDDETIELFQELIDSGDAYRLQGFYGRTAEALIESGHCRSPRHRGGD